MKPVVVIDPASPFADKLARIEQRTERQHIQRNLLRSGGRVAANVMRRQAPRRTGALMKSIGYRVITAYGEAFAEVGPNIGTRTRAPHAHLVLFGTKPRRTKSGANRGRVRGANFIPRAMTTARSAALAEMTEQLKREVNE